MGFGLSGVLSVYPFFCMAFLQTQDYEILSRKLYIFSVYFSVVFFYLYIDLDVSFRPSKKILNSEDYPIH